MISRHTGDGRAVFKVISLIFDKPSRMLQRRLIDCFFSGSFGANEVSQISELQTKINSMGKTPDSESILAKVNNLGLEILAVTASSVSPSDVTGQLNPAVLRAVTSSPLAT